MKPQDEKRIQDAINTLQSVLEPVKTYPVGYDPGGLWTIKIRKDSKYHVEYVPQPRHVSISRGESFTTKEQAEKSAAGKNAMKELVFAIDEENAKHEQTNNWYAFDLDQGKITDFETGVLNKLTMTHSHVPTKVREMVTDENIKLALKWGM